MADSKKLRFLKPPILKKVSWKFQGLVLGLVGLTVWKGIGVAQGMTEAVFLTLGEAEVHILKN